VATIQAALLYDVRRGPHSIGAHVRDAAAYVCWAFARAYEPHLLANHVNQLAATLLTVACYDREINCRRCVCVCGCVCVCLCVFLFPRHVCFVSTYVLCFGGMRSVCACVCVFCVCVCVCVCVLKHAR